MEPLTLEEKPAGDDQLAMMFLCCHASLSEQMQVALTLQVVCGLNARQVARGFMLSEAAVAQRLVRVKRQLRESGARFESEGRLESVLAVLYLLFNEGYALTEDRPPPHHHAPACRPRPARAVPASGLPPPRAP